MTWDHKDTIKATYHGNTPSVCSHIIQSYLDYTRFNELIEERCNLETGRQYQSLEPFKDWWNDYISDEEDFVGALSKYKITSGSIAFSFNKAKVCLLFEHRGLW